MNDSEFEKIISKNEFQSAEIGGLRWIGDADNEMIFGTAWMDNLIGNEGNDHIYGMEGNDFISGGDGIDRLFGGGGDDRIVTRAIGGDRGSE